MNDQLPGKRVPYFLRAGEGERYLVGGELATFIARHEDTGGPSLQGWRALVEVFRAAIDNCRLV